MGMFMEAAIRMPLAIRVNLHASNDFLKKKKDGMPMQWQLRAY